MRLFETVKMNISLREAAHRYGVDISRTSMALCPFHPDRNPSLFVADDHFHCFGCGEHGDVIDFTSKLFGISGKSAAKKLVKDFGLNPNLPPDKILQFPNAPAMDQRDLEHRCITFLKDQINELKEQQCHYAPKEPGENFDPRFLKSCHELPTAQYLLDTLLIGSTAKRGWVVELLLSDGRLFEKESPHGKTA